MAKVIVKKDENIEVALKRFKRLVQDEGIMQEVRRREFYLSPAQKRRLKSENAQKRLRRRSK